MLILVYCDLQKLKGEFEAVISERIVGGYHDPGRWELPKNLIWGFDWRLIRTSSNVNVFMVEGGAT